MNAKSFLVVLVVSFLLMMSGVMFFFKPIAVAEEARLVLPPAVALVYIVLCAVIYAWGFKETNNCYKAAAIVVVPQVALIIDLMLRGDRGPITALAGTALLVVTWLITAFIHHKISNLKGGSK